MMAKSNGGRPRNARPAGFRGELAERVERLRTAKGLTQPELAEAAGVGLATIARVERGDVSPSLETLAAIARALGTRPRELLRPLKNW